MSAVERVVERAELFKPEAVHLVYAEGYYVCLALDVNREQTVCVAEAVEILLCGHTAPGEVAHGAARGARDELPPRILIHIVIPRDPVG